VPILALPRAVLVVQRMEATGPNAQQIQYWNDTAGEKWVRLQAVLDEMIRPLGQLAMARARLRPGERVLDVGCGCGDTTAELGCRVAPGGSATGVDICGVMLERARELASERRVGARFELADAQTHAFPPAGADVVFSRFGVMFFADPTAAFTNLRRALARGGRLAFVCWQALPENPWMFVPLGAALQHVPPPPLPGPDAPGPFAFADPARVRGILDRAGYRDIAFEDVRETLTLSGLGGLDRTVDFMLQMGPTSALLREASDPTLVPRVAAAVRAALEPYLTSEGVRMASASWVVTARA
jgi:SAM-dependent methyltransferase